MPHGLPVASVAARASHTASAAVTAASSAAAPPTMRRDAWRLLDATLLRSGRGQLLPSFRQALRAVPAKAIGRRPVRERHQLGVRVRLDLSASAAPSAAPPPATVDAPVAAVARAALRRRPRQRLVQGATAVLPWRRRLRGGIVRAHLQHLPAAPAAVAAASAASATTTTARLAAPPTTASTPFAATPFHALCQWVFVTTVITASTDVMATATSRSMARCDESAATAAPHRAVGGGYTDAGHRCRGRHGLR